VSTTAILTGLHEEYHSPFSTQRGCYHSLPCARETNTICIMTTSEDIRKKVRSGKAIRSEPQDLALVNEDMNVREYFE
jgi:hypothetical protein